MKKKFATAINCMDGRIQLPVIKFIQDSYNVDYVDLITEPGPNKLLAQGKDKRIIENLKKRVKISVEKHGSTTIVISGHCDCAGNTEEKTVQIEQTKSAMEVLRSWNFQAQIIGLWIDKNWKVCKI